MKFFQISGLMLLFMFSISEKTLAQDFPKYDADSIRLLVNSLGGKSQYSNLLLRLQNKDTSLTAADYFLLYHGLPFQKGYDPYQRNSELQNLFEEQSYPKVIAAGKKILKLNPVDLDALFYVFASLKKLNKTEEASVFAAQYLLFIESILASGDGTTTETAFHVSKVTDEYSLLSHLNLQKKGQVLVKGKNGKSYDMYDVRPSDKYTNNKIYFNITLAFLTLREKP